MPTPDPVAPAVIVVTGERIARRAEDSASSVAVITRPMIEAAPAPDRIEQAWAQIPNVQLANGSRGPTIRGQDSTGALRDLAAFIGGNRPRATISVDGRALGYFESVFGLTSLWDVEQVEVFRSPQTTTQGRNAIAGAIFVTTADPAFAWSARARAIAGSLRVRHGSAMLTGPLIGDQLAIRASADGRLSRPSSRIGDNAAGADPMHDDFGVARLKLLALPDAIPGLRIETGFSHVRSGRPQFDGVVAPFEDRRDPDATYGIFRHRIDSLTALVTYAPRGSWSARTTLSAGRATSRRFAPPGLGIARVRATDLSAETVFDWRPDTSLKLIAGARFDQVRLDQAIDVSRLVGFGRFDDVQRGIGLFGEVEWRVLPRLRLTGGIRFERDSQKRSGTLGSFPVRYEETFTAALPKFSIAFEPDERTTLGLLVQRAFNPGGLAVDLATGRIDRFAAEHLWDVEAFARTALLGGRLRLKSNLFYYAMTDPQRPQLREVILPDGTATTLIELGNAKSAHSYGAELEAEWAATPRLALRAGLGLLATRIDRTLDPDDPIAGKQFERAPPLSATAAIDWTPTDRLHLSIQARHNRHFFSDDANTPALRVAGATVVDGRAAYDIGAVTLFAYGRNLTDDFYLTQQLTATRATVGKPRELGFGIERRF